MGPNGTSPLPPPPGPVPGPAPDPAAAADLVPTVDVPTPPVEPTPPDAPVQRMRTWPAILALYVLAPAVGEMLSGSTPPLLFFTPFSLIFECGLYGSGAVLVRELVRRRGLGWGGILLVGAAYGILEEALVVTSWFNPYWPDLGRLAFYGRALDTSWVWAL